MKDRFWPESKSCLPDPVWPCIRACISGGTVFGYGGPILAAKISLGRPILAAKIGPLFAKIGPGDHFWGTDFCATADAICTVTCRYLICYSHGHMQIALKPYCCYSHGNLTMQIAQCYSHGHVQIALKPCCCYSHGNLIVQIAQHYSHGHMQIAICTAVT